MVVADWLTLRRPLPAAPLLAIHRAEIAVRIGPLVPDAHAVLFQVADVGVATQEPDQLMHDRLQVQLLRRDQRKAFIEVEAHLPAEHAACTGASAIRLDRSMLQYVTEEIEVLAHGGSFVGCSRDEGVQQSTRSVCNDSVRGKHQFKTGGATVEARPWISVSFLGPIPKRARF